MSEKDAKIYTVVFNRIELTWLMRQLEAGRDRADGIIKTYSGDAISKVKATEEQLAQLKEAHQHKDVLDALIVNIKDRLAVGERERLAMHNMRLDLLEAMELAEEQSAKDEAAKRLGQLPQEEEYKIQFDRGTVKFTLRLLENDLLKFRAQVIPAYEKAAPEDFEDPIQTKSYWVNKARKSKDILESLKIRLEKKL